MNTKISYGIVDGPDARTLFDACRYVYAKNIQYDLNFEIVEYFETTYEDTSYEKLPLVTSNFHIVGIEHDNGSGESFRLKGYCDVAENGFTENYGFVSYYNTRTRKGVILFSR